MKNLRVMKKAGKIQPDKLLWRVLSDGADRLDETFDLALLIWKAALLITLRIT